VYSDAEFVQRSVFDDLLARKRNALASLGSDMRPFEGAWSQCHRLVKHLPELWQEVSRLPVERELLFNAVSRRSSS
jgi:hypothetical protein